MKANGNITDVKLEYPTSFAQQLLEYGQNYRFLPNYNQGAACSSVLQNRRFPFEGADFYCEREEPIRKIIFLRKGRHASAALGVIGTVFFG